MEVKNLNVCIEQIKTFISNFKKAPNRIVNAQHILDKQIKAKTLKTEFDEIYFYFARNPLNIEKLKPYRDRFQAAYLELKQILQNKAQQLVESEQVQPKMADFSILSSLKSISIFEGDYKNLQQFLNIVELIHDSIKQDDHEKFINFVYKTKLNEKVLNRIAIQEIPKTFDNLKLTLQGAFKSNKSIVTLQTELNTISQNNSSVASYVENIENIIAELNSLQINDLGDANKPVIQKLNDALALNSFKVGLDAEIKSTVFAAQPKSFSDAVKVALEVENASPKANIFHLNRNQPNFRARNWNNRTNNLNRNNSRNFYGNNASNLNNNGYNLSRNNYRGNFNNSNNYRGNFNNSFNYRGNYNNSNRNYYRGNYNSSNRNISNSNGDNSDIYYQNGNFENRNQNRGNVRMQNQNKVNYVTFTKNGEVPLEDLVGDIEQQCSENLNS